MFRRNGRLRTLFVTGYRAALSGIPDGSVIGKPSGDDELAAKVRLALAGGIEGKIVRFRWARN